MDYIPLATMLATGDFEEADQVRFPNCLVVMVKSTTLVCFPFIHASVHGIVEETEKNCIGIVEYHFLSSNRSSVLHLFFVLQFTRDALIEISGAKAKGRNFVYFTDVKNIPNTDLATIERLWLRFSGGKFGYSVQKKKWRQSKNDFEVFCQKIGWTTKDGEVERKKRWFGASEFTYDVKKAPEGHLPLTSALRGTSLLKNLLNHPVWETDEWQKEP